MARGNNSIVVAIKWGICDTRTHVVNPSQGCFELGVCKFPLLFWFSPKFASLIPYSLQKSFFFYGSCIYSSSLMESISISWIVSVDPQCERQYHNSSHSLGYPSEPICLLSEASNLCLSVVTEPMRRRHASQQGTHSIPMGFFSFYFFKEEWKNALRERGRKIRSTRNTHIFVLFVLIPCFSGAGEQTNSARCASIHLSLLGFHRSRQSVTAVFFSFFSFLLFSISLSHLFLVCLQFFQLYSEREASHPHSTKSENMSICNGTRWADATTTMATGQIADRTTKRAPTFGTQISHSAALTICLLYFIVLLLCCAPDHFCDNVAVVYRWYMSCWA